MKSLKDIRTLSLQLLIATLRDAEQIQAIDLQESIDWVSKKKFPDIIIDLCKLGKQVETSLITCTKIQVDSTVFPLHEGSDLPDFMYPLFSCVFTDAGIPSYILDESRIGGDFYLADSTGRRDTDWVVAKHAASAVMLLRQVLLLFSKSKDIPVIAEEESEIQAFIGRVTQPVKMEYFPGYSSVYSMARRLLAELLTPDGVLHPSLAQWIDNPFGRHGPGAVADREKGREKWSFTVDVLRLPSLLYRDTYCTEIGEHSDDKYEYISRLCVVPKDFRGHRLICAEPKELQFAQQGLLSVFEQIIRGSRLTSCHISLHNQEPSYYMSRSLKYATIDMKDASDYVTLPLLRLLLPKEVFSLITRFRSSGIQLPNGEVIHGINTAFTMGNALCFPIETLVFWALALATILSRGGTLTVLDFSLTDSAPKVPIRVFGDDLIVPFDWCYSIVETLTHAGLVINKQKTCKLTLVRESCGSWWYAGYDCRVTKLKYATELNLLTWTSFQDVIPLLRENGMLTLASELEEFCVMIYPTRQWLQTFGNDPRNWIIFDDDDPRNNWLRNHTYSGEWKLIDRTHFVRYNSHLQRMEYRMPVRSADNTRALSGSIGLTAYWTNAATRVLYTNAQCIKYKWVEL